MILVTGASGYIGQAFLADTRVRGEVVIAAGRYQVPSEKTRVFDLECPETFEAALQGVHTVVHLAGLGHGLAQRDGDYAKINADATKGFMAAAVNSGVRRFVLLSSMNVVPTSAGDPALRAELFPEPADPYSASKWQAELALNAVLAGTACQGLIVRAALTYDQDLHANLASLQQWVRFLPVALPKTGARTLVSRFDLAALLGYCATAPTSKLQPGIWAATDGQIYDSRRIGAALGAGSWVLPEALWWLAAHCRDAITGLRLGSTWSSLAGARWAGQAQPVPEWSPTTSLETCLGSACD